MIVKLNINGFEKEVNVKPNEYLLDTLRSIGYKSVKKGCDGSACGACVVLLDDKPILSCSLLTVRAAGHEIKTVEAIQEDASRLADYFSSQGADQCGYCNAALALMMYALKKENPNPTDEELKNYVVGNLCRCTGYQSQQIAMRKFLDEGGDK